MAGKRNDTPAAASAERVETPLADSWQASVQKGATPGIFPIMWRDGFAVGHGTVCKFTAALRLFRYDKPLEHEGKKLHWAVEGVDYAEDLKTVLRIWGQTWFETEEQAKAELPKFEAWARAEANKKIAAQKAAEISAPPAPNSVAEQDLRDARLKVMREQYPDTFKAMDALAESQPEARPAAMEALFRAYAVDVMRLHKPAKLGEILPFKLPDETSFILEIAKAYKAKCPRDPVDVEIAARCYAAGYDKMKLDEYTAAINVKTGANLKPEAMKKRRLKKLRLLSARPEGRPSTF